MVSVIGRVAGGNLYENPDVVRRDVRNVNRSFNDLQPKLEEYVFNDGNRRTLLQLDGTIPVWYTGVTYNIPICIWLMDTHPHNPPMVYVKPTISMHIKPGRNVDSNGKVDLPYLREWRYPNSDLLGMIQILIIVFSKEPPVCSAPRPTVEETFAQAQGVGQSDWCGEDLAPGQLIPSPIGKRGYGIRPCTYFNNPDVRERDVLNVQKSFNDLRSKLEEYVFDDDTRKSLLQLYGTIPVSCNGALYNIPICIWLMDTHPYNPPIVYVKPTTSMHIKPGRNVDSNGKVDLPYLREWRYPNSDLLGMIQMLRNVFSKEPPVYSGPAAQQQQRYPAGSPGQTPYPPADRDEELRDTKLCKICLDNELCITFVSCGHLATCEDCAKNLKECPICRKSISKTLKTYWS